jgi:hypothetical protein
MTTNINGPVNYCYMKGSINGIEKEITLFMDVHNDLDNQTRCDSFDSIDISHLMYKKIVNTDKELDFFLEITFDEIKSKQTNKRDIYIKELFEMFKSEFTIEKINNTDIVRYSKSNSKVRLHFLDIRNVMDFEDIRHIINEKILKKMKLLIEITNNNEKKKISSQILKYFQNIYDKLNKLTSDIDEIINSKSQMKNIGDSKQKYYINKIFNRCNDKKLKQYLINFMQMNYKNTMFNLDNALSHIKNILENIELSNIGEINEIYSLTEFVREAITDLYCLVVDCFLLRRVLDKDYINNSIIYTGFQHSIHYMYFLHKYYNFEITKIFHTEKNLDKMLKQIKNSAFVYEIYSFITDKKKTYAQCISYEPYETFAGGKIANFLNKKYF